MSERRAVSGPRFELGGADERYPGQLALTADPPQVLRGIGDPAVLARPGLAVVGARKATPYGLSCAKLFAGCAALQGITVISGGAIGCDQAAQTAALDAGGTVVSVAGSGADYCYPANAHSLYQRIIATGGAVVSELPWGTSPRRHTFVRRNRIIAGLARAILIVEAGLGSGTFSTADAALADGRDVLVVPGSIFSPESAGSNRLLGQGAIPVYDERSFLDALTGCFGLMLMTDQQLVGALPGESEGEGGASLRTWVLRALTASPMRPDALAREARVDISVLMAELAQLELAGEVERYRDGRYGAAVEARIGLTSAAGGRIGAAAGKPCEEEA